ncbi:hypothetical protein GCM10011369_03340 [Neiella marina]|uniref:Histidine kinase n=1 Tax=Neiella marina TaxID=508461 RepID=A0A8J2XMK9_9GAMM|nr:two-component regulator propeller domain-containing protein [Neiella marina]GGA65233.1 hypothetical protein GCM10011369_03340 [Neiella marina]
MRCPFLTLLLNLSLAFLLVVLTSASHAKINVHQIYLEDEGKADYNYAVVKDQQGFLWIASDNGLKRYDGYRYTNYVNEPEDPNSVGANAIPTLLMEADGTLWAGGHKLSRYNPKLDNFDVFSVSDGTTIWAIYRDANDILWVGGEGFGLRGFDLKTEQLTYQYFTDPNERFINAIVEHRYSDSVWIASSNGLYLFNTNDHSARKFNIPADLDAGIDTIRAVVEDQNGFVWVGTQDGIVVLDPKTEQIRRYTAKQDQQGALKSNTIWSIFEDSRGQIWIGTDKQGVHRYLPETDSFLHVPADPNDEFSFPPGAVSDIYEDETGSIWFSVSDFGIYRISEHLEKFIALRNNSSSTDSLGFDNVLDLHEDKHGAIWIATDGGGLDRYSPDTGQFKHYRFDDNDDTSLSSDSVIAIGEDQQGHLWFGTWAGLTDSIQQPKASLISNGK